VSMPVDVEARVIRNARLSSHYNVIELAAPEVAINAAPGQFVMVKPGRGTDPLLRRPFSVFEIVRSQDEIRGISLLSKRIGATTDLLFGLVEGDVVTCLGPLGRPFDIVGPPRRAWMVAGGVGLAPFATLTDALRERGTDTTLFYGARTREELFYVDWFERRGVRTILTTEDGSAGELGRITAPLEAALKRPDSNDVTIYACGPEPMLKAVARLGSRYDTPTQVSVERVMGCGLGGCYSCVIPVKRPGGGWQYVRSCIGGPVFLGDSIVWV